MSVNFPSLHREVPAPASGLSDTGYDAVHVRTYGMQTSSDEDIFDRAAAEDRIVVSADTDFGTLLALRRERSPSVILFLRAAVGRASDQLALLVGNLPSLEEALDVGCVAVLDGARIRVRQLPIVGASGSPWPGYR